MFLFVQHSIAILNGEAVAGFATGHLEIIKHEDDGWGGPYFYLELYYSAHPGKKEIRQGGEVVQKSFGQLLAELMLRHAGELEVLARVRTSNKASSGCLKKAAQACGRAFEEVPTAKDYKDVEPEILRDNFLAWEAALAAKEDIGEERMEQVKVLREEYAKPEYLEEVKRVADLNSKHGILRLYRMPLIGQPE
jgi:hypothetical protein